MIKNAPTSQGFLIDGYPRELEQGKRFEQEVRLPIYPNHTEEFAVLFPRI